jgi:hypothetical protein
MITLPLVDARRQPVWLLFVQSGHQSFLSSWDSPCCPSFSCLRLIFKEYRKKESRKVSKYKFFLDPAIPGFLIENFLYKIGIDSGLYSIHFNVNGLVPGEKKNGHFSLKSVTNVSRVL